LAFKTAAELYGTPLADGIGIAEDEAAASPDAAKLAAAYEKAVELLREDARYAATNRSLMKSLDPFKHMVYLTDTKWSPPFSPNAAPIHKLLVAHARRVGK